MPVTLQGFRPAHVARVRATPVGRGKSGQCVWGGVGMYAAVEMRTSCRMIKSANGWHGRRFVCGFVPDVKSGAAYDWADDGTYAIGLPVGVIWSDLGGRGRGGGAGGQVTENVFFLNALIQYNALAVDRLFFSVRFQWAFLRRFYRVHAFARSS